MDDDFSQYRDTGCSRNGGGSKEIDWRRRRQTRSLVFRAPHALYYYIGAMLLPRLITTTIHIAGAPVTAKVALKYRSISPAEKDYFYGVLSSGRTAVSSRDGSAIDMSRTGLLPRETCRRAYHAIHTFLCQATKSIARSMVELLIYRPGRQPLPLARMENIDDSPRRWVGFLMR